MINLSKSSLTLNVVTLCRLGIGATTIYWLSSFDFLRSSVAIITLLLTMLPARLIQDKELQDATSFVLALLLAAHILLGMQAGLYETSSWYDKFIHTLGSCAIAVVMLIAIKKYCHRYRVKILPTHVSVLVVAGTLSAGTLWEFFEYAIDATGLFQAQRGLDDTMQDLIADAVGAILIAIVPISASWIKYRYKRNHRVIQTSIKLEG